MARCAICDYDQELPSLYHSGLSSASDRIPVSWNENYNGFLCEDCAYSEEYDQEEETWEDAEDDGV